MTQLAKLSRLARWDIGLCLLCAILFLLWPELDLIVAGSFYHDGEFTYENNPLVRFVYLVFAKIHFLYLLGFIGAIIYCHKKGLLERRKLFVFLLSSLLIGPGILVNTILKDNTLGRPRPEHIQQFGGERDVAPTFYYSGQCDRNCSFVSGHASIGFYLLALAWVRKRRIWLAYGVALGAFVGLGRIIPGGPFFCAVLFAGWVAFFACLLFARAFGLSLPESKQNSESDQSST